MLARFFDPNDGQVTQRLAAFVDDLLRKARSTLLALNVELHDEDAEKASPIVLPRDSFEGGVLALPNGGEAA